MPPSANGQHRVVITGLGAVTNIGHNADSVWTSMRDGKSGITPIANMGDMKFDDYTGWSSTVGGQVHDWTPSPVLEGREAKKLDRCTQLGVFAAHEAVTSSGVDFSAEDPSRVGCIVGSGIGGIYTIETGVKTLVSRGPDRINPFTVPRLMANAVVGNLAIRYGLRGPATAHATACASSGHAIGDAMQYLRRGMTDVMLVGGAEAACTPLCLGAFMTMKALTTRNDEPQRASRPFDVDRDGFVLSEGAAMYVLETEEHAKKRGANILGELVGFGNSCDAHHITAPDPEGSGALGAMRMALADAQLAPDSIGYVNAHGTSTPLGDAAEVAAVTHLFGDHVRRSAGGKMLMSSTKSVHGHCLGASGAIEMIACLRAVREGVVAPTINLDNPDAEFDIDLVAHEAKQADVALAMNNTFGFGGHNVTLIVGRYTG
ncbi:MAG: beta-ketoacyl-ACP synthase II [Planctomycetota bacterium]